MNCVKGCINAGDISELGQSAYGLFQVCGYHLELETLGWLVTGFRAIPDSISGSKHMKGSFKNENVLIEWDKTVCRLSAELINRGSIYKVPDLVNTMLQGLKSILEIHLISWFRFICVSSTAVSCPCHWVRYL